MALPVVVCLVGLALHVVLGEAFSLSEVAKGAQTVMCAAGDVWVLCYVPERVLQPPASLLVLVNAAAIVSALACMAGIVARRGRNAIVFRVKKLHWLSALLLLAMALAFVWGAYIYKYQSFAHTIGMSVILAGTVDFVRFALASILAPREPRPPSPPLRRGWFGAPLRRARFAPGMETGEKDAT